MFSFQKPSEASVQHWLRSARDLPLSYGNVGITEDGPKAEILPTGFVLDHTRTEIGHGEAAFERAKSAFRLWLQFELGWVRVANPEARIDPDQLVAVEAHALGLWSVNISRIIYVIDETNRFGFGYGTTTQHIESGEERFLLEYYPVSGAVLYDLFAVSRAAHWLAKLGNPFTRSQQRRFARESHQRMKQFSQEA